MATYFYTPVLSTTSKFTSETFDELTALADTFIKHIKSENLDNFVIEEMFGINELYSEFEEDSDAFNKTHNVKDEFENMLSCLREYFEEDAKEILERNNKSIYGEGALIDTLRIEYGVKNYRKFKSMMMNTWDFEAAKELVDEINTLKIQSKEIEILMNNLQLKF